MENVDRIKAKNAKNRINQGQVSGEVSVDLKSARIFEMMRVFLVRGEGKEIVKKVEGLYNFELKKSKAGKVEKCWIIDLKNGQGKVCEGRDAQADATFTMVDEEFEQVCFGNLNPQMAFIQGKMKIKGNMRKATIFTPELFPQPTPENILKYTDPKI